MKTCLRELNHIHIFYLIEVENDLGDGQGGINAGDHARAPVHGGSRLIGLNGIHAVHDALQQWKTQTGCNVVTTRRRKRFTTIVRTQVVIRGQCSGPDCDVIKHGRRNDRTLFEIAVNELLQINGTGQSTGSNIGQSRCQRHFISVDASLTQVGKQPAQQRACKRGSTV